MSLRKVKIVYIVLWLGLMPLVALSQKKFQEGVIYYKADTVKRAETVPSVYIDKEIFFYCKNDLARIEITKISRLDKHDSIKIIQIKRPEGFYFILDLLQRRRFVL